VVSAHEVPPRCGQVDPDVAKNWDANVFGSLAKILLDNAKATTKMLEKITLIVIVSAIFS
jgi:hypothetical protein